MTPIDLRQWRTTHRLSLTQLGEALGVHRGTVYAWEHQRQAIPPYLERALRDLERERDPART